MLEELARAGDPAADPDDILWQAKPHIGTDRLRRTVKGLRQEIERLGGTVHFGWQAVDLHISMLLKKLQNLQRLWKVMRRQVRISS